MHREGSKRERQDLATQPRRVKIYLVAQASLEFAILLTSSS